MKRVTMLLAAGLVVLAATTLPVMRAVAQDHVVSDANLKQKLEEAKTPADHEMIAEYYDREAAENEKKAELHRDMRNMYTKPINQLHCNPLVTAYQQAASQDKALAVYHREMAKKVEAQSGQ
ncbi:MAG TPA: hypothetical protein VKT99_04715 [Xanthobacteraceae bacterium]|nr:hypothetical protein [Xanthobacteraceae bacterium]